MSPTTTYKSQVSISKILICPNLLSQYEVDFCLTDKENGYSRYVSFFFANVKHMQSELALFLLLSGCLSCEELFTSQFEIHVLVENRINGPDIFKSFLINDTTWPSTNVYASFILDDFL